MPQMILRSVCYAVALSAACLLVLDLGVRYSTWLLLAGAG